MDYTSNYNSTKKYKGKYPAIYKNENGCISINGNENKGTLGRSEQTSLTNGISETTEEGIEARYTVWERELKQEYFVDSKYYTLFSNENAELSSRSVWIFSLGNPCFCGIGISKYGISRRMFTGPGENEYTISCTLLPVVTLDSNVTLREGYEYGSNQVGWKILTQEEKEEEIKKAYVPEDAWWKISKDEIDKLPNIDDSTDGEIKILAINYAEEKGIAAWCNPKTKDIVAIIYMNSEGTYAYWTGYVYKFAEDNNDDGSGIESTYKWYGWGGSGIETGGEYEGDSPITEEDIPNLTRYVSDEYIKSFINSFNE